MAEAALRRTALRWALALSALGLAFGPAADAQPAESSGSAAEGDETHAASEAPDPAEWIRRSNRALHPGESMSARASIVTIDRAGNRSKLVLDYARVSEEGGPHRTLVEVREPAAGKGTVYQIHARPGERLRSWIWLPEAGRLRAIRGIHRTDPFLGTEFTYEDLALAAPVERMQGTARFVREGDERHVLVESEPYHYYERVVTRIDAASALPERVAFFDRAGFRFRVQTFEEVETIEDHPLPRVIRIRNRLTGTESVLRFEEVELGAEVGLERFEGSPVGRELRRDARPEAPAAPEEDAAGEAEPQLP